MRTQKIRNSQKAGAIGATGSNKATAAFLKTVTYEEELLLKAYRENLAAFEDPLAWLKINDTKK